MVKFTDSKKAFVFCLSLTILQGCNGTSGENGDDPFGDGDTPTPPVFALSLTLFQQDCTTPANRVPLGEQLCAQASLTRDGTRLSDQIIDFSATIGDVSVDNTLTSAQGVAEIFILSDNANLGAGQVSASYAASTGTVSQSANFEILAAPTTPEPQLQLQLGITDNNGLPANRVNADETLALTSVITDADEQPVANQIVSFQATIGTVSPETALTNAQGQASATFTPDDRLGAGSVIATATIDTVVASNSQNIEVLPADSVNNNIVRLGTFENGSFIEGVLGIDSVAQDQAATISAGGTVGLNVALVDENEQPVTNSIQVTFTSTCVSSNDALIDQSVVAVSGIARSTFQDISCAGASGNDDVISASIATNGQQTSVSRVITLQPEDVGAVRFVDADPTNIVLAGSGGQNTSTVSTVTFQVDGTLGNPLAQQTVDFALNTNIGGLSLAPTQGITNSEGQVSTRVTAGTVPTAVRVTASIQGQNNTVIQSQSELLSVNTGLPDQNSVSLAADNLNPEAFNIDGVPVIITARLGDSFNNPVPDGTAVSFISEGGSVEPSCTTINGACSVQWTSGQPRVDDHRLTILATAVGHETLFDSNGNNQYEATDGPAVQGESGSGLDTFIPNQTGFSDLPEAWLDENEDNQLNGAELFLDFNSSGSYDSANNLFDGPQCASDCGASSLHVRRALVLVTSSSEALLSFFDDGNLLIPQGSTPVASIARGDSLALELVYSDTALQPIASGSTIVIVANQGNLSGATEVIMPITNSRATRSQIVTLTNDLLENDPSVDSTVTATVTSPSGVATILSIVVTLE